MQLGICIIFYIQTVPCIEQPIQAVCLQPKAHVFHSDTVHVCLVWAWTRDMRIMVTETEEKNNKFGGRKEKARGNKMLGWVGRYKQVRGWCAWIQVRQEKVRKCWEDKAQVGMAHPGYAMLQCKYIKKGKEDRTMINEWPGAMTMWRRGKGWIPRVLLALPAHDNVSVKPQDY